MVAVKNLAALSKASLRLVPVGGEDYQLQFLLDCTVPTQVEVRYACVEVCVERHRQNDLGRACLGFVLVQGGCAPHFSSFLLIFRNFFGLLGGNAHFPHPPPQKSGGSG